VIIETHEFEKNIEHKKTISNCKTAKRNAKIAAGIFKCHETNRMTKNRKIEFEKTNEPKQNKLEFEKETNEPQQTKIETQRTFKAQSGKNADEPRGVSQGVSMDSLKYP
jgi:hypothetical protein